MKVGLISLGAMDIAMARNDAEAGYLTEVTHGIEWVLPSPHRTQLYYQCVIPKGIANGFIFQTVRYF